MDVFHNSEWVVAKGGHRGPTRRPLSVTTEQ